MSGRIDAGRDAAARPLPTGTVTFLRSDVEGSMASLAPSARLGRGQRTPPRRCCARPSIGTAGSTVRTEGDALFAAFQEAGPAVLAAIDGAARPACASRGRRASRFASGWASTPAKRTWPATTTAGSRSTGRPASQRVGHGGQIVVSGDDARAWSSRACRPGVALREPRPARAPGRPGPEQLFQLDVPGLPHRLPAPAPGPTRRSGTCPSG